MKARAALTASLKTALNGKRWHFVSSERNVDNLGRVAIIVRQQTIRRAPEVPLGAHQVGFTVTVVDPKQSWDAAEAALDNDLDDVLHALDGDATVRWTEARKVLYDGQYLAYDIDIELYSGKE